MKKWKETLRRKGYAAGLKNGRLRKECLQMKNRPYIFDCMGQNQIVLLESLKKEVIIIITKKFLMLGDKTFLKKKI